MLHTIMQKIKDYCKFLTQNVFCATGEDASATRTEVATIVRSDIAAPQTNVKEGDVRADVTDDVMASINPPFVASSDFFGHLPEPKLTSCTGE